MNNDLIYLKNKMLLSKCSINNKKQLNKKIIISGTHNNRLECFFNKYFSKTKHFSNCAIIRCYDNNRISLIYSGDHNNNSYWLLDEFNLLCENNNPAIDMNIPEDTEIFLVRHGKGIHNHDKSLLEKIYYYSLTEQKDPSLDQTGVKQAQAAGDFLNKYIKYNYINNILSENSKIYFTASHLIRTQQTIGLIMEQMNIKSSIYIAPCTHELIYVKPQVSVSDCDCSVLQNIPVKTNIPNCDINNMCPSLTKFCHTDCYNTNPIPLNWDYYKLFYKTNQKCCNNNMINQIINTIQLAENPN